MADRRPFTREQLLVINALRNAHAEAARELARLTDPLQRTLGEGKQEAWREAEKARRLAHNRCEALHLAVTVARETFLKANEQQNGG